MADTTDMETLRPRAFDPESMSDVRTPPPAPGWDIGPERRIDDGKTLAGGLAWFSIGLGLVQLLATDRLCRYLDIEEYEDLVRLYGLREIATGVGIMSQREPTPWIAGRIAGDLLDLATLGLMLSDSREKGRIVGAIGAVAGVTVLDVLCHRQLTETKS